MQSRPVLIVITLLSSMIIGLVPPAAVASGPASLSIWSTDYSSPDIADPLLTVGSIFVIDVMATELPPIVNSTTGGINGFDITVEYDSNVLNATDANWEAPLCTEADGCLFDSPPSIPLVREFSSGRVRVATVLLAARVDGSGTLFKIMFQIVGTGFTAIDIVESVSALTGPVGGTVQYISYKSQDGSFTNLGPDFDIRADPVKLSLAPGSSGTFTITLTSLGGFSAIIDLSATVTPPVADGPLVSASPSSVALGAGASASSALIVFTVNSTPVGGYNVTVRGSSGALSHSITVNVNVSPPTFGLAASPASLNIPAGTSGSFVISVISNAGFSGPVALAASVSPLIPDGPSASLSAYTVEVAAGGRTEVTLTVSALRTTPVGSYTVRVTGSSGTLGSSIEVSVFVSGVQDFTINATPFLLRLDAGSSGNAGITLTSINGFSGDISLTAEVSQIGPNASISLSLNPPVIFLYAYGEVFSGLTVSTSVLTPTGTYEVTVTGTSGSIAHSVIVSVNVLPSNRPPVADFAFNPRFPLTGETVFFDGFRSSDPDGFIQSWTWTFGDGSGGFGPFVQHAYFRPGDYVVTLTVFDDRGASGMASQTIHVRAPPMHDVAIESIFVYPTVVVSSQFVNINVVLRNLGTHEENVTLTLYYDSQVIRVLMVEVEAGPYTEYISIAWDTLGVGEGNYTIRATAFLATDEFPGDNELVDGRVVVLPPPRISVTPDRGSLGEKIVVQGSGFPVSPYGFTQALVSFDDMFLGFAIVREGRFEFVFNLPHAEPGLHQVKAFDFSGARAAADFLVLSSGSSVSSDLVVEVEAGTLYFPGDKVEILVLVTSKGVAADLVAPGASLRLEIILYKPDGSRVTLNAAYVGPGLYRASYSVARTGSLGTYAIVARAELIICGEPCVTDEMFIVDATGMDLASFQVKPSWISVQGPRIASATVVAGVIAVAALAWRKGYFRRKDEAFPYELTA